MDESIGHFSAKSGMNAPAKETRPCPWRRKCIFGRGIAGGRMALDCPDPLPESACKWVYKIEGCIALLFIAQNGEASIQRIGECLRFGGARGKEGRLRAKLNVLAECHVIEVLPGVTERGANLYTLGSAAPPIITQSLIRFKILQKKARRELNKLQNRIKRLTERLRRMEAISLLGGFPSG